MGGRVFHAPLVSSVEGLELAAVMERSTNHAAERYPGLKTHRSVEAMLADSSLDLFVVTTPSGTHFEIAKQILEAGRNVVVDKPTSITSNQIAQLIDLAAAKKALLVPFHNRRWDSDFLTIQKLLGEGTLGRLVAFESRFDRWRPAQPTTRLWKEDPAQGGGVLLDLGTHIADQALTLFGLPESVSAEVLHERDGGNANDAFEVRLRYTGAPYPGLIVTLGANCLALPPSARFHIRGTQGNYWKFGLDPQEAALNLVTRIEDPDWGHEPVVEWGSLHVDIQGGTVTRPVEPMVGNYRRYYEGVRDAVLGKGPAPIDAKDAWRVSRLLEYAAESAEKRQEIVCNWN
jgi:predicted dehydrogenase